MFTDPVFHYKLGILLIYNYTLSDFKDRTYDYLNRKINENNDAIDNILVICKQK